MLKTMLLGSLAALTALVLGLGARGAQPPRASAVSTDVVVIGCELIAPYVDGDPTNAVTDADVARACGGTVGGAPKPLPAVMLPPAGAQLQSVALLAKAIGNADGKLTASDFRGGLVNENWDDNQISTDCSIKLGAGNYGSTVTQMNTGFACTLDVFVFVSHDEPVTIDADAGLVTIENGTAHFVCNADASDRLVLVGSQLLLAESGASLSLPPNGTKDNDCNGGQPINGVVPPDSFPNNGDGVVMFHLLNDNAKKGDVKTVRVTEGDVTQTFTVNIVGPANNVQMKLAESVIETGKSETVVGRPVEFTETAVFSCIGRANKDHDTPEVKDARPRGIPGRDVADPATVSSPTSTLGWAIATDQDNRVLTRVPVTFIVTPPEDNEIVRLGVGNPVALVTGNTKFTRDPGGSSDVAAYVVICGGKETGKATIAASINAISCTDTGCTALSSLDKDKPTITVVGAPATVVLSAVNASIKCDGSETATVTAKVTDSAGNDVADGVPVNFSVIARGTAKPGRTVTKDGKASTQVTAFSESTEGLTVGVDAGDVAIANVIQSSIRVDCAKALGSAPPPAAGSAPAAAAPARSGVHGPDTGTGGADASRGLPAWPMLALIVAALTLAGVRAAVKRD